jgi:hypothetical protein
VTKKRKKKKTATSPTFIDREREQGGGKQLRGLGQVVGSTRRREKARHGHLDAGDSERRRKPEHIGTVASIPPHSSIFFFKITRNFIW